MIRGGKIEDRSGSAAAAAFVPPTSSDDDEDKNDNLRSGGPHPLGPSHPAPATRKKAVVSFPLTLGALLLLSLAVFGILLYASVQMVIVEERGSSGDYPLFFLRPSSQHRHQQEDDDDDLARQATLPSAPSDLKRSKSATKASTATKATKGRSRPIEKKKSAAAARRSDPSPTSSTSTSPYAYVFLLVGCDAMHPASYRPLLSSIYVAIHLLRKYGSTQDAIVYVMMSSEHDAAATATNSTTTQQRKVATPTTLSAEELRILAELKVTVRQIPSVSNPTFHRITLQKFRVLGLTQYRRVMFLDCDVMPLINMDVFFELSDPAVTPKPLLKENLVFLDYVSPANAGTFMLSPHDGDLKQVNDMIREAQLVRNQGVEGKEPWRQFPPDHWDAFDQSGSEYNFHLVSGDQGLLWSWVRHYQRQFSYVVKDGVVKNYGPSEDGSGVGLESVLDDPFAPDHGHVWPAETAVWGTRSDAIRYRKAHPPKPGTVTKPHEAHIGAFGSLFHFLLATGGKPWYREGCKDRWDAAQMPANGTGIVHAERARRFWCQTYHEISVLHNISIPASDLNSLSKVKEYHPSIGSEMWATPGPVTDLLEPDFDPRPYAATSSQ